MKKFEVTWLEDRSDDAVLTEIRRVAALVPDRRLTVDQFNSLSRIKSTAVRERFGSWNKAVRKAGLPNALPEYSDIAIIQDLRFVSASSPEKPFTRAYYSGLGHYSASCVTRRFGGWQKALDAAGIGNQYEGPLVTEQMRKQPGRAMSNEELLAQIRAISVHLGNAPLSSADILTHSKITPSQLYRRFGSVSAALRQAGVEQVNHGKRHTEDEVFENLLKVWTHYGRAPTTSEMDQAPSTVGKNTYITRYGRWRKALKAFVERVNGETDSNSAPEQSEQTLPTDNPSHEMTGRTDSKQSAIQVRSRPSRTSRAQANVSREDRRDPSIGLRYRVLKRDQFRCRQCGRSPATEVGCVLHVDHVIPFSKGGKTTLENLQTLCKHCNIGKSDD
jgi:5-methylcytosine-specific restriction endonuclease McrA